METPAVEGAPDFEAWVHARGPALLRFAYLLTGDPSRAEEAVQDALVAACSRWRRIVRADDPEAYVRRMVVNADVSRWRRFLRRETPVEVVRGDVVVADPSMAVTEEQAAWALVRGLPARQRAAVVLRFYEGLPDREIAEILGCAEGTVRSQISRALEALRRQVLAEEEVEGHG